MRTRLIVITPVAIAGAAAAILTAPIASAADTQACVAQIHVTLCQSPGNAQFQSEPPAGPPAANSAYGPFFTYDRGFGHR